MSKSISAIDDLWVPKDWSIMVYMAGGMDIGDEARECLLRMKQVGSTKNIHLIAQFDSGSEGTFTKRYYLKPFDNALEVETILSQACAEVPDAPDPYDDAAWIYYYQRLWNVLSPTQRERLETVPSKEIKMLLMSFPERFKNFVLNCILDDDIYPRPSGSLGNTNAGDPGVLADFIRWAKARYPAKNYLVVLWGHGSGLSVAWDYPPWPLVLPGDSLTAHELLKAFERETEKPDEEFVKEFVQEIKSFIKEEIANKKEIESKEENSLKGRMYPDKAIEDKLNEDEYIKSLLEELAAESFNCY
jgi:hypothetical protein